jgi:hypothetical protein
MKLSDYLSAINHTKVPLLDDEMNEKEYVPFVINRCLSYFPDTILHANLMNFHGNLPKKMQFDYFLNVLRKRKRFSKWLKNENGEHFFIVKEYFGYSDSKTKEIIDILTKEQIQEIISIMSTKTQ